MTTASLCWKYRAQNFSDIRLGNISCSTALLVLYNPRLTTHLNLTAVYLNTSGIDPRQHPVKNELDRVKEYMKKIKESVAKANEEKNPQKLDKAAANRFIKAGLVDADGMFG